MGEIQGKMPKYRSIVLWGLAKSFSTNLESTVGLFLTHIYDTGLGSSCLQTWEHCGARKMYEFLPSLFANFYVWPNPQKPDSERSEPFCTVLQKMQLPTLAVGAATAAPANFAAAAATAATNFAAAAVTAAATAASTTGRLCQAQLATRRAHSSPHPP